MRALTRLETPWSQTVFAAGLIFLAATAFVWRDWISLGTQALLVPFQCECTWNIRPAPGTPARSVNDFFDSTGRNLPASLFLAVSGAIVAVQVWKTENKTWIPLLFAAASAVFLAATFFGTGFAWTISDWINGPRVRGIDAGYHRTVYALAANGLLWVLFWFALVKLGNGKAGTTPVP